MKKEKKSNLSLSEEMERWLQKEKLKQPDEMLEIYLSLLYGDRQWLHWAGSKNKGVLQATLSRLFSVKHFFDLEIYRISATLNLPREEVNKELERQWNMLLKEIRQEKCKIQSNYNPEDLL